MTIEQLLGYSTEDLVKLVYHVDEKGNILTAKGDADLENLIGEHFKYTRPELTPTLPTTDSVKTSKSNTVKSANKAATKKANMAVELAGLMKLAGVKAP